MSNAMKDMNPEMQNEMKMISNLSTAFSLAENSETEVSMFASFAALSALSVSPNNNALRGQLASRRILFGEFSRYSLYAVHVRMGDRVCWMVSDAETICQLTGLPEIIRQGWSPEEALRGLESEFSR